MRLNQEAKQLMVASASPDKQVAQAARQKIAAQIQDVLQTSLAVDTPIREGKMDGPIGEDIFTVDTVDDQSFNSSVEYPIHWLKPGEEGDYIAYTVPTHGSIDGRIISADYVQVPVYDTVNGIDWDVKFMKAARGNILAEATNVLRAGFVQKRNDDKFHVLLAAGASRNVIAADSDAAAGQFSVRLLTVMQQLMRRNGGGNSSSMDRVKLTDLVISPEGMYDMRSWNVDQIDEVTRREIFTTADGTLNRIFQTNIRDYDEFGEGQKYQTYYTSTLSGSLPSAGNQKLEVCLGLDLTTNNAFVNPVQETLQIREDPQERDRKWGVYGWETAGYAVLDSRRVLLGAF